MTEHGEQVLLFEWAKLNIWRYPELELLFAIPNGGNRPKRQNRRTGAWYSPAAQKLQAEGLKAGVPDICLPVARGPFHGLYIENKTIGGGLSQVQRDWLVVLANQEYLALVCWSFEDQQLAVETYLKEPGLFPADKQFHQVRNGVIK